MGVKQAKNEQQDRKLSMMLVKTTCQRREVQTLNIIEFEQWFTAKDLNQVYNYVEKRKYWTLVSVQIYKYTDLTIEQNSTEFTCINHP